MKQYHLVLQGLNEKTGKTVSQPMDFIVAGSLTDGAENIRKHFNWPQAILLSIKELEDLPRQGISNQFKQMLESLEVQE